MLIIKWKNWRRKKFYHLKAKGGARGQTVLCEETPKRVVKMVAKKDLIVMIGLPPQEIQNCVFYRKRGL